MREFVLKLRTLLQNQWWLEPALPVVLAFLIFSALTYILVSGTKRDRLSSEVESIFIGAAIDYSSTLEIEQNDDFVVVTATDQDRQRLPNTDSGFIEDINIETYARVLESILKEGPSRVYFSWLPASHHPTIEHLRPIIDVVERYEGIPLYFGYPVEEIPNLEPALTQSLNFLEADDCGRKVQVVCSYNSEWRKWIIQHVANLFAPDGFADESANFVSLNLPHFRPNYIMNLPQVNRVKQLSFGELLQFRSESSLEGKVVFVGPDFTSRREGASEKRVIRKTFTPLDDNSKSLGVAGTPMHVFWSQVALMFKEQRMVAVAPLWVTMTMLVLFCALIIFLLLRYGAAMALGTFMFVSIGMPLSNLVGMRYMQVYIPVFEVIYGGLMVFLFASMGFLSFRTYQRWRLGQLTKAHAETADLRTNFISVISHNLNTPIAQMQGLLDILHKSPKLADKQDTVEETLRDVSLMQLFVRSVLLQPSIDTGVLNKTSISLRKFVQEFHQLVGGSLKKFGVETELKFHSQESADEGQDEFDVPLFLDVRALAHCIANLRIIEGRKDQAGDSAVELTYDLEEQKVSFNFPMESEEICRGIVKDCQFQGESMKRGAQNQDLLDAVFARLVQSFTKSEDVKLSSDIGDGVCCMKLVLHLD